jgi:hypothetical protein
MQQITFHRLLLFKRGTIGKKENSIALLKRRAGIFFFPVLLGHD